MKKKHKNKPKLWAFGCSNTWGWGLDCEEQFQRDPSISRKAWERLVRKTQIKPSEYSWPNTIARRCSLECINLARGGSGLDYAIRELERTHREISWDRDTVLLGVPKMYRYQDFTGKFIQVGNNTPEPPRFVPSDTSLELYYRAGLEYVQRHYPEVILVKIYHDDNTETVSHPAINTQAFDTIQGPRKQYPCGHPDRQAHREFAQHILERLEEKRGCIIGA